MSFKTVVFTFQAALVLSIGACSTDGKDGPAGPEGPTGPTGPTGTMGGMGATGDQGPAGVVAMVSIPSGSASMIGNANSAFYGAFATVTTTATQRVSGVVSAWGQTSASPMVASIGYGMCSRVALSGATPALFGGSGGLLFVQATSTGGSFSASESKVLGAGTWEVGLCGQIGGGNDVSGSAAGWVMVTN